MTTIGVDRVDTTEVEDLTSRLVSIDSINPNLVPGGSGEVEIAAFVSEWLRDHGLQVEIVESQHPNRPNVVAVAKGTGGGQTMMLNGHLDTVGIDVMDEGLIPRTVGSRLYGRGASDMKGAVAALMLAAADTVRTELRGDVIFTAVADEEYRSLGTEAIAARFEADGAIVAEPTGLRLGLAHKGFVWIEVETDGVAAHGSRPDVGIDAVAKMGHVLVGIEELGARLALGRKHPLLGPGSVHASLITGGHEISTYPDHCELLVERRTIPGETEDVVLAEIEDLLDRTASQDPAFLGRARITFSRRSLDVPPDAPISRSIAEGCRSILGHDPEVAGMSYWTDAAILAEAGIPTVVFGPTGEGDHAAVEWVDLPSVELCRRVVRATADSFCG
jgi:acetylornithine deacetylase/succinyl-diaminopimelate desuccinylase-like protein